MLAHFSKKRYHIFMNNKYEIGQQIETTIVAISGDTVFIDLNEKSEGVLAKAEITDENGKLIYNEGDKIKVYFVAENRGEFQFTTKLSGDAAQKAGKEIMQRAFENKIPVEGKVEKEIKGGYEVTVGNLRAFCPYSQMGYREREEASHYIGRVMTFLISEYRDDGKSVVLSNRALLEQAEKDKREQLAATLNVGSTVNGEVVSLKNYGAFVDIGGFQALLPASEISYKRVEDVSAVLKVGQKVTVKIISADWKAERVSVSMKELEEDPWESVTKKIHVGDKISGKVARVAEFGIFVNLAAGIDGLVHISKLKDVSGKTNLRKVYKSGDAFDVVIDKIEVDDKRISLSPATSSEEDKSAEEYLAAQNAKENDSDGDDSEKYNPFAIAFAKKRK